MTVIYEKPTILITQDGISGNRANAFIDEMNAGVAATAADRVQTGLDRAVTAADRVQTGLDRSASAASAAQAALYDGPRFDDFAAVVADTVLSYTVGAGKTVVAVGSYVLTSKGGFAYQVAASGATDHHVTTAGGVKLYVMRTPAVDVRAFGAIGDGVADDTNAIRGMVAAFGVFTLPAGTFKITDEIIISPTASYMAVFSGAGAETSRIVCSGMAGKKAIRGATPTGYYRHTMRDFGISGDADNAINFTTSGGYTVYQCEYRNLVLSSLAGSSFFLPTHFSCSWYNVHVNSVSGHGFELGGGNSTLLVNCYAHEIGAGTGKCGYKIKGSATLISCNGVDTGDHWGIFGATVAFDGANAVHQINIIGGNCEDFGVSAIKLRHTGQISIYNLSFVPKATGTYETLIDGKEAGNASSRIWLHECGFSTKGSTMTDASRIMLLSAPLVTKSDSSAFTDFRVTSVGTTYTIPSEGMSGPTSVIRATKFDQLDANKFWGYANQNALTWTANSATFSVASLTSIKTGNTGATTFTNATGAEDGQKLTVIVKDAFTTFANIAGGAGQFKLAAGANVVCAPGDVLSFVFNSPSWVQQSSIVQWRGSSTYDPPSLIDGASATTTVTVTGAALGDVARASFSLDTQGIVFTAWVSAANTVSVRLQNNTGSAIDLASGTLRAIVTDLT